MIMPHIRHVIGVEDRKTEVISTTTMRPGEIGEIVSSNNSAAPTVTDLFVCEIPMLTLHVEQLYRFHAKKHCAACANYVSPNRQSAQASRPGLPSLSSFQKLVLRSLLFLVRSQHASTILLEGVEPLVEDIRRVIEQ